jgi:putative acetyltransferase
MKTGKIIRSFSAKDGSTVTLRTPRWEDLDDLLELINSLVEEGADITKDEKISREGEVDWLSETLASVEKDEKSFLVAEVNGKVIASCEIHPLGGCEKHVGIIGIAIKNGFRDIGIGTEAMKTLMDQAQHMGLTVLTLSVFAVNTRALHVYEKVGFVQTGSIPKKFFRDGTYIDEIIMTKLLESLAAE